MSVHVYTFGICHASVCAPKDMAQEEVEHLANRAHPTGIESRWRVSDDKTFHGGEPNPCTCDQDAERLHYLMVC